VHDHQGCLVTQREVGVDTASFGAGLKSALRQAPDVILMRRDARPRDGRGGSALLRDRAPGAPGPSHANNANQAVRAVPQLLPGRAARASVYAQLALNIRGIVSQRLVPKPDGQGRRSAIGDAQHAARRRPDAKGEDRGDSSA